MEEDGRLEDALKALLQQMDLKSDTCLASIPWEDVSYRNIQLPFKEPKKIRQTLPYEIEGMVPFPIEDLVVDFSVTERSSQSDILVVSVKKGVISEYLTQLQAFGIDPDVIEIRGLPLVSWVLGQEGAPDHGLLLEISLKRYALVFYLQRRVALVRTFDFDGDALARSIFGSTQGDSAGPPTDGQIESDFRSLCKMVRNTIHAFQWQNHRVIPPEKVFLTGMGALYHDSVNLLGRFLDLPVERINLSEDKRISMDEDVARVWNAPLMDAALALALRDDRKGQGFNLRKDDFEIKKRYLGFKQEIRKAAILLTLVLLFIVANLGVDYHFLEQRYRMLDQKISAVFKSTFPEASRVEQPVNQMKVKIRDLRRSADATPGMGYDEHILDLLRDISERVPKTLDVHVTRMVIDPETVRISGDTNTFNTVDTIKNGLDPSIYFTAITISSANLDRTGKRVQFELSLQRAK